MKKIFFTILFFAILFISCDNNSKVDTQTHDDGSVHNNHTHDSEEMPKQESFEVESDSLSTKKDSATDKHKKEHSHAGGHTHKH